MYQSERIELLLQKLSLQFELLIKILEEKSGNYHYGTPAHQKIDIIEEALKRDSEKMVEEKL